MNIRESKRLKPGDLVVYEDGTKGQVIDTGYRGVTIKWVDDQCGTISHDHMKVVTRLEK